jgi:hypothetical protein
MMQSLDHTSTPAADSAEAQAIRRFARWRRLAVDIHDAAQTDRARWRLEIRLKALRQVTG